MQKFVYFIGISCVLSLGAFACASGEATGGSSSDITSQPERSSAGDAGASTRADASSPSPAATDGGSEPSGKSGTLTFDGQPCTVQDSGLDTGLDGNGWTLQVTAACENGVILTVSGVSDAPYPQTATTPFLDEEAAQVFLDRGDGVNADTFNASAPGGRSYVTAGPTSTARARVTGTATVVDPTGNASPASHTIAYDFAF